MHVRNVVFQVNRKSNYYKEIKLIKETNNSGQNLWGKGAQRWFYRPNN